MEWKDKNLPHSWGEWDEVNLSFHSDKVGQVGISSNVLYSLLIDDRCVVFMTMTNTRNMHILYIILCILLSNLIFATLNITWQETDEI